VWGHFDLIRDSKFSKKHANLELQKSFIAHRGKIPLFLKDKLRKNELTDLTEASSNEVIDVNRKKSQYRREQGFLDDKGTWTVFGAVQKALQLKNYNGLNANETTLVKLKGHWFVRFKGE